MTKSPLKTLHHKSSLRLWRLSLLSVAAFLFGSLCAFQCYRLFPTWTARILLAGLGLTAGALLGAYFFRAKRLGLRVFVVVLPLLVAGLVYPFHYMTLHQRLVAKLEKAKVASYSLSYPNSVAAFYGGTIANLTADRKSADNFRTELAGVWLKSHQLNSSALSTIPSANRSIGIALSVGDDSLDETTVDWIRRTNRDSPITLSYSQMSEREAELLLNADFHYRGLLVQSNANNKNSVAFFVNSRCNSIMFRDFDFGKLSLLPRVSQETDSLDIGLCNVGSNGFDRLLKAKNPKILQLLWNSSMTKSHWKTIASLPRIEGLSVSDENVTAKDLRVLRNSKSLTWIAIYGPELSKDDIQPLQEELPKVKVHLQFSPAAIEFPKKSF